jgi:hypothetical protein
MRLGPTEKAKVVFHDGFSVLSWEAAMWRREEAGWGGCCCWSVHSAVGRCAAAALVDALLLTTTMLMLAIAAWCCGSLNYTDYTTKSVWLQSRPQRFPQKNVRKRVPPCLRLLATACDMLM